MTPLVVTAEHRDLLHALGFFYLRHGQERRALVLTLLAARMASDDPNILKTLAHAFLANGKADQALETLDRLRAENLAPNDAGGLLLLRSRALLQRGDRDQARRCFRQFLESRAARR